MSHRRHIISIGAVATVIAGTVAFGVLARPDQTPRDHGPGIEPLVVTTAEIRWEDHHDVRRSFVGRVEARQQSDLGFEIGGRLAAIAADEGDVIAAGTVIARLDVERLEARRAELVASQDRAEADEELARLTLERLTVARDRGAATDQEWDEADLAARAAGARLRSAGAAIDSIDVDLAKAVLTSPYDAIVANRFADTGRVVTAGAPIVRLVEHHAPEVRVGIGGTSVASLRVGAPVTLRLDDDRTVAGTVRAVLPTRDRTGRGVDARIELDATLDDVRVGDLARLDITRSIEERGFWVPVTALAEGTRGLWTLLVLEAEADRPDTAVLRRAEIELLHEETDRVFVRGAVDADAMFVVDGLHRVVPGMNVRPRIITTLAGGRRR